MRHAWSLRFKKVVLVVAHLVDGVENVVERAVRALLGLGGAREHARVPPARRLLHRRHVQLPVEEVVREARHLAGQEGAVAVDGVPGEQGGARLGEVVARERQHRRLRVRDAGGGGADAVGEAAGGVVRAAPRAHRGEDGVGAVDAEAGEGVEDGELGVRHHQRHLQQDVRPLQPRHLAVDPQQVRLPVGHRHAGLRADWTATLKMVRVTSFAPQMPNVGGGASGSNMDIPSIRRGFQTRSLKTENMRYPMSTVPITSDEVLEAADGRCSHRKVILGDPCYIRALGLLDLSLTFAGTNQRLTRLDTDQRIHTICFAKPPLRQAPLFADAQFPWAEYRAWRKGLSTKGGMHTLTVFLW